MIGRKKAESRNPARPKTPESLKGGSFDNHTIKEQS
jgi:hypothetical protein